MHDMTRRMLLGGVFASLALPALARRDDDPQPVPGRTRVRTVYRRAPARHHRWPVPPENEPNLAYQGHNRLLRAGPASARRVVMMGDSITYAWGHEQGVFFRQNGLVDRGIGGETSAQMLLRFDSDVIAVAPRIVHIMAGTNDLAALRHPYDGDATRRNIQAMAARAKEKDITVILASVPPASGFSSPRREPGIVSLKKLNVWIRDLCEKSGYTYCDYWPALRFGDRLKPGYGKDGVHPNAAGYAVMGPVLLAAIDAALKKHAG
jgi:lysophospholipase L1-like esterase